MLMNKIDTVLAAITGVLLMSSPYASQQIKPSSTITSIGRERSFVCLVLIVLIACGRNANVVKNAALKPIIKLTVSNLTGFAALRLNPPHWMFLLLFADYCLSAQPLYTYRKAEALRSLTNCIG